jgi:predicted NACHT family NTPase
MEKSFQTEEIKRSEGLTKKIIKGKDTKDVSAQRILLLGRSGVGKTYNGCKYLLSLIKEGVFSPRRVVVVSKTWKSDPSQKELTTI